jgi:hypothetical protein
MNGVYLISIMIEFGIESMHRLCLHLFEIPSWIYFYYWGYLILRLYLYGSYYRLGEDNDFVAI